MQQRAYKPNKKLKERIERTYSSISLNGGINKNITLSKGQQH